MNDSEFKNKMMSIIRDDCQDGHPPIAVSINWIDENGYSGTSYHDVNARTPAFKEHSKNSFYSKKNKQSDTNKLCGKKLRMENERKILDEEYREEMRLKKLFKHNDEVVKPYEEKTIVENQTDM